MSDLIQVILAAVGLIAAGAAPVAFVMLRAAGAL